MKTVRLLWHDYCYFPYERALGRREARVVFGCEPREAADGLVVNYSPTAARSAATLTYFKAAELPEGLCVPDQAKLEASSNINGHAWNPALSSVPSLRRQSTRYSAHGLHDYRGKFNPQVVRAVGNLFGLRAGAWVLDPFSGSGTTLLEAAHIGWNCVGLDLNPLGNLIANAKVSAFTTPPKLLLRESESLLWRLERVGPRHGEDWPKRLPEPEYLAKWFREPVLCKLATIVREIENIRPASLRPVFLAALSDICRDVSLQDPADLRIRRRKTAPEDCPVFDLFADSLRPKVASVVRARTYVVPKAGSLQTALLADSRKADDAAMRLLAAHGAPTFEAAITSPPYATALPYLDTQRLSLAILGLVSSRELRAGERQLIGNREIQEKERLRLEAGLLANEPRLPEEVCAFCLRLLRLADDPRHGFRRRNMPALVFKYLSDMALTFTSVRRLLRARGFYALLVGRNKTELRGEEVAIDTPQLLARVAESRGWTVEECLPFETYHRYDVHQENSIREEVLLILRNG
jgi:site-specific DNA-methyltransferase (cytosine-N4-specific)